MNELFLSVLKMSITASYVILFVILIRLLLRKAPKIISYALWAVVAFRLIVPFSFESHLSLLPKNTNIIPTQADMMNPQSAQVNSGMEAVNSFISNSLSAPTAGENGNSLFINIGSYIWVLGIFVLLGYSIVSVFMLRRHLKNAQFIEGNIYEAKNLKTPFVLGFFKPKIYLPIGLTSEERSYILLHEQTHIHRKDHIMKVFAFIILSLHWFNPLVWLAFKLMCTDMEQSCDESVLKKGNQNIKKAYAHSLLTLAAGRNVFHGNPLAFGEGDVKGRIKNVLKYKKPKLWVVLISMVIAAVVGIGLLTNPISLLKSNADSSIPQSLAGYMTIEDSLLSLDEVEIITSEDAERIEELEQELGHSIDLPNGYYIYNASMDKQTFEITNETTYNFVDFHLLFVEDEDGDRKYSTTNKDEFMAHLNHSYSDQPPAQNVPFFIEVKNGKVISITEKFEFTF